MEPPEPEVRLARSPGCSACDDTGSSRPVVRPIARRHAGGNSPVPRSEPIRITQGGWADYAPACPEPVVRYGHHVHTEGGAVECRFGRETELAPISHARSSRLRPVTSATSPASRLLAGLVTVTKCGPDPLRSGRTRGLSHGHGQANSWLWHKDRDLVTLRGIYVLSRILFRSRSRLARPNIWRLRALTRQTLPSTAPLLWARVSPLTTAL